MPNPLPTKREVQTSKADKRARKLLRKKARQATKAVRLGREVTTIPSSPAPAYNSGHTPIWGQNHRSGKWTDLDRITCICEVRIHVGGL